MSDRLDHWTTLRTFIALAIAAVAFVFIGNIGGKNGNPSWLLAPICLLVLIVLAVRALIKSGRSRA